MKRTNYVKLGVFVVIAVVLAVSACIVAGVRSSHPAALLCETYIDGTVHGVDVGSAVKYRGIPIGKVRSVSFSWTRYGDETPDNEVGRLAGRWARVVFAIETKTLTDMDSVGDRLRAEVEGGLRVSLKSQGITGVNYLDLDYPASVVDLPAPPWVPEYVYVPSVPSLMQTVTGTMQNVAKEVAKLGTVAESVDAFVGTVTLAIEEGRLPFADIGDNLRRATASLDELLKRLSEDPSIVLRSNPASQGTDPPDR